MIPLLLGSLCVTQKKTLRKEFCVHIFPLRFIYGHTQVQTKLKERGNPHRLKGMLLCNSKAICGMTSLRVTVLSLLYESLMTGKEDQGKKIEQQLKVQATNTLKIDTTCTQKVRKNKKHPMFSKVKFS